jgi:hypothetical protein
MGRVIPLLFVLVAGCRAPESPRNDPAAQPVPAPSSRMDGESVRGIRQVLMEALTPVSLSNCEFTRIGSANDGGYVMCGNLLSAGQAAYSYGIGGHDGWGCDVSKRLRLPVHQYDCFEPPRLTCEGGQFVPHDECVGPKAETVDGRVFGTLANQIARNGDAGKVLIMKMDVEGAEWNSLLAAPDALLERIDQLAMELHGTDELRFVEAVQRLKRYFYPVHIHFNNWACRADTAPFPAPAYQVLFVNKRVAKPGPAGAGRPPARQFDAPDNPAGPDCQLPTP